MSGQAFASCREGAREGKQGGHSDSPGRKRSTPGTCGHSVLGAGKNTNRVECHPLARSQGTSVAFARGNGHVVDH